jgi:MFS family permease
MRFRQLLRQNPDVRWLWLGQVVSQFGDWFNVVAVYALLLDLTGSATAVAVMMVVQQLPIALVGPAAGALVDRLDRRRVMIGADLLRATVLPGLLLVDRPAEVWLAYVIVGVAVVATAFFEPARAAILPALARREELLPANALSSATWSAMLAVGAALGGAVVTLVGRDAAFLMNACSFLASAVFIARIRLPSDATAGAHTGAAGLLDGLRYIARHREVLAFLTVKGAWAVVGGILVLVTVFGERVIPLGHDAAAGIGVLYASRGIGAGLGALLTRAWLGSNEALLTRALAPAYLGIGASYLALAAAPNVWVASLAMVAAHAGGSVLWVASTVKLQLSVADRYRGRVFAIEFAVMMMVSSAASYLAGVGLDRLHVGPRALMALHAAWFVVPAAAWFVAARRALSPPRD